MGGHRTAMLWILWLACILSLWLRSGMTILLVICSFSSSAKSQRNHKGEKGILYSQLFMQASCKNLVSRTSWCGPEKFKKPTKKRRIKETSLTTRNWDEMKKKFMSWVDAAAGAAMHLKEDERTLLPHYYTLWHFLDDGNAEFQPKKSYCYVVPRILQPWHFRSFLKLKPPNVSGSKWFQWRSCN